MKKAFIAIALGIFLAMTIGSAYAMETFITPAGTTYWDKTKAYNGYTTVAALGMGGGVGKSYLIDMEGNVVHVWNESGYKLMPNGNLFAGFGQSFREVKWDSTYAWGPWTMPDPKPLAEASHHHDSWWMKDAANGDRDSYIGNIFWKATNEEVYTAGGDPSIDYTYTTVTGGGFGFGGGSGRSGQQDAIWIVDKETGEITWEWKFLDHTIQDRNPDWPNYVGAGKSISDYPGKCNVFWMTNDGSPEGPEGIIQDWMHCNSLNYNQDLDHVVINAKHWSEFYVIDHGASTVPGDPEATKILAATEAGDFIYRWGNPSAYGQGDAPAFLTEGHQQMFGSHNIHWIDNDSWPGGPELQGMGNFLIYSNGCYMATENHSEIQEINPFLNANGVNTGNYVNPPDAGYNALSAQAGGGGGMNMAGGTQNRSNQLVWYYKSNSSNSFYSSHISGCHRLPNGNTVVCSGTQAHLFEVTYDGEVVWDYPVPNLTTFSPYVSDWSGGTSPFRCQRYGSEYPGLAAHLNDLVPMGKLTERGTVAKIEDKLGAFLAQ